MRQEWLASRDAQQHTLQWTFAASALILAAILNSGARTEETFLYVSLAGATAALSTFSQAVWFGEVLRMERASMFLRGLEAAYLQLPRGKPELPPLMWDTWRSNKPQSPDSPWISPASSQIIGGFALYQLLNLAAIVVLLSVFFDHQFSDSNRGFALGLACCAVAIYVGANYYMCRKALYIYKRRAAPAQFDDLPGSRRVS